MRTPFAAYIVVIVFAIVSGMSVFFSVFLYTRYHNTSKTNVLSLENASYPLRITKVDENYQWIEGEDLSRENRTYTYKRVYLDAKTYILERTPRIENGIFIGYASLYRITPDNLHAGLTVYSALETRADLSIYTPLIIVEGDLES